MSKSLPRTVFFLTGCKHGGADRYRCDHHAEQLKLFGIESTVADYFAGWSPQEALAHDLVILHRVPYDDTVGALIAAAHRAGKLVLYDVDDLVFEPHLAGRVDALHSMSPAERDLYVQGTARYRATMEQCDAVLTATNYLAGRVRRCGVPAAYVVRNAASAEMIRLSDEAIRRRAPHDDRFVIGYFSGTATHDKDFLEAAGALHEVMVRYPFVDLHVRGPLRLPPEFDVFGERVQRLPLLAWRKLPAAIASVDVVLALLEQGNPYCRAKSEIKWMEAALVGRPVVASRIDAFEFAVQDGETGFLAGDPAAWRNALTRLIEEPDLCRRIGEAARQQALDRYRPEAAAEKLRETLQEIASTTHAHPDRHKATPLVINWLVSRPIAGSGGHTDIFRLARSLVNFGHKVRLLVEPVPGVGQNRTAQFIHQHFFETGAEIVEGWNNLPPADALIATTWPSAYVTARCRSSRRNFYLVQDFEPYFYAMGTQYLYAEGTYRLPLFAITLGPWLARLLRERYGMETAHFPFGVDRLTYYPRPEPPPDRPRIVFYARPSTPRRCFDLGIEALARVAQARPDVEIVLFGTRGTWGHPIPFPHTNRGILNHDELARLYSGATVGLSLSPTNCSLIPFEMMACRCPVVELAGETTADLLRHEENALLADPNPQAVAHALLRLLDDDPLRQRLIETGYEEVQTLSWERSARRFAEILQQQVARPAGNGVAANDDDDVEPWSDFLSSPIAHGRSHDTPLTLARKSWDMFRYHGPAALWNEAKAYIQWRWQQRT